jgi:hypothetical protein
MQIAQVLVSAAKELLSRASDWVRSPLPLAVNDKCLAAESKTPARVHGYPPGSAFRQRGPERSVDLA